ncbi:MAG: NAD(P)H-dependent oxidoreductase [Thermoplasmata archaeon]
MADSRPIRVLGICGSLRKGSTHRGLLRAAQSRMPAGSTLEIAELHDIPPFNADHENDPPAPVRAFKEKIRAADAILFAAPEYNYSIAGVLKNAIDWASRPPADNVWAGKAAAIVSTSVGLLGGARGQYHLRQSFVFLRIRPVMMPECFVPFNAQKFDADGNLTDEGIWPFLTPLLEALVRLARTPA